MKIGLAVTQMSDRLNEWHQRLDERLELESTPEQVEASKTVTGTLRYIWEHRHGGA